MLIGCDRTINCQGERYGGDLSMLTLLYLRFSGLSSWFSAAVYRLAHLRLYARLLLMAGGGRTIYSTGKELKERTS